MGITKNTSNIKNSEQEILNLSKDDAFDVLAMELLEFDGVKLLRKESSSQQMKTVAADGYTYICKAPVGTAEATAKWQVFRLDASGNKMYADANANYDNAASDPASLSFSYS